jgi:hypothetical protein
MKTFCPVFIIAAYLFCCVSCKQNEGDLIYSVSDFNTPISCVAPSQWQDSSIIWLGFENGNT